MVLELLLVSFLLTGAMLLVFSMTVPTRRDDMRAIQAMHTRATPRLGGIAILATFAVGIFVYAPAALGPLPAMLVVSLIPVLIAGLLEDIGRLVSPKGRLLAAAISSLLAITTMGMWVARTNIPGLDLILAVPALAICLTVFWGAAVCHAMNLVDGLNGLAAGIALTMTLALSYIAAQSGDAALAQMMVLLLPAIAGFLVFNWPLGRIFLGDAGAYGLGHILVWFGVLLAWRSPDVSGTAIALVYFWPIADTLCAVLRRLLAGKPVGQPDKQHVHQLVLRAIEALWLGRRRRDIANPVATVLMLPVIALPPAMAALTWNNPMASGLILAAFTIGFLGGYAVLRRMVRHWKTRRGKYPHSSARPALADLG